jgi:hypothetical protein
VLLKEVDFLSAVRLNLEEVSVEGEGEDGLDLFKAEGSTRLNQMKLDWRTNLKQNVT